MAWLVRQMKDAGMVAEAEVLLQQLYTAVQAVKVRPGLLLCLCHCSSPDLCLTSCSSILLALSKSLQPAAPTRHNPWLHVKRSGGADADLSLA